MLIYIFPSNAKKFIKSHMRATCFVVPLKISSIVFRPKVDMRRSVLRFVITTWVLDCELQCLNMVEDWNALFDLIFCSCMRTVCHSKPNGPHQNKNAHVHESILLFMYIYIYIYDFPYSKFTMAQLVEAQRYKPQGRGFDSRWYHWNFSLT